MNLIIFRFATVLDLILVFVGGAAAIFTGLLQNMQAFIFDPLINALDAAESEYSTPGQSIDFPALRLALLTASVKYAVYGAAIFTSINISMMCWQTVSRRAIGAIRRRYMLAVLRQEMAWFDRNETGEIASRLNESMDRIRDSTSDKVAFLFQQIGLLVCGLTMGVYYCWQICAVVCGLFTFALIPYVLLARRMVRVAGPEKSLLERASSIAQEVIYGIRTVMAFNGQTYEIDRFCAVSREATQRARTGAVLHAACSTIPVSAMLLLMAVSTYYGATLISSGETNLGAAMVAFWSSIYALLALIQATPHLGAITQSLVAIQPIFQIIDRAPLVASGSAISDLKGRISVRKVSFAYPTRKDVKVLNNVSFEINPGEKIAFVGLSGSGKSTLIGLLLRLYDLKHGEITIDGRRLDDISPHSLRDNIGLVSQEPNLFSDTVLNNILIGNPSAAQKEVEECCRLANAHEFITQLPHGYDTRIGEGGVQLSGGQKQRIAIARTLIRRPEMLLLDEATAALDTESERIVQRALDSILHGRTSISIAHRLATVSNADRIYVFDKGEVVESGSHDELMNKQGLYASMVTCQAVQTSVRSLWHTQHTQSASQSHSGSMESHNEKAPLIAKEAESEEKPQLTLAMLGKLQSRRLIVGIVMSVLRGAVFPTLAVIYGEFATVMSTPDVDGTMHEVMKLSLFLALLAIFSAITQFFGSMLVSTAGLEMTQDMKMRLYTNFVWQDGSFFDREEHNTGALVSLLATEPGNLKASIDLRCSEAVGGMAAILFGLGLGYFKGWQLANVAAVFAVALIVVSLTLALILKHRSIKNTLMANQSNERATETIDLHRTIVCLNREDYFAERYSESLVATEKRALVNSVLTSLLLATNISYLFFNFSICFFYGLQFIEDATYSPMQMFTVNEACNSATLCVLVIATYIPEFIRGQASIAVASRMLARQPKINAERRSSIRPAITGRIDVKNVQFGYDATSQILKGVNFKVKPSKTVALVGPSGSGKSTMVQLIERFYDPTSGHILIDAHDSTHIDLQHLRSNIAIVSQEPTLFNYTIRENITYGLEGASHEEVVEAAKLANAHEFICALPKGYSTMVGERGSLLSGGQKQRIAIARAVIRKPKILLLDEATSALDAESEKMVQVALDLARKDRTCLVIAHRMATVMHADLIIVMQDGNIVESGTHAHLIKKAGVYAMLCKQQSYTASCSAQ